MRYSEGVRMTSALTKGDQTMMAMFTTRQRDNGETFTVLADDAPEWLRVAVRDAHGGEMPDDWRYEMCAAIWDAFGDWATPGDADDVAEMADDLTSIYNADRLAWLAARLDRIDDVDEALRDYGADQGVVDAIGLAMYRQIEIMATIIGEAINENAGES